MTYDPRPITQQRSAVPKGRFELPRGYPHYALNVARLPVPPLRPVMRPPPRGRSRPPDSNRRPAVYETAALPTELGRHAIDPKRANQLYQQDRPRTTALRRFQGEFDATANGDRHRLDVAT